MVQSCDVQQYLCFDLQLNVAPYVGNFFYYPMNKFIHHADTELPIVTLLHCANVHVVCVNAPILTISQIIQPPEVSLIYVKVNKLLHCSFITVQVILQRVQRKRYKTQICKRKSCLCLESQKSFCVLFSTYPSVGQISKQGYDHFPSGHCQPAGGRTPLLAHSPAAPHRRWPIDEQRWLLQESTQTSSQCL